MTQSYPSSAAGALSGPITNVPLLPIPAKRAPTVRDINYAIGQQWVYVAGNEIFFLSSVVGNTANWVQLEGGGGGGAFNITGPTGTITTTAGPLTINSGTGTLGISTDAAATTVDLGTGAGVKTVFVGSATGASATTINSGTAGLLLESANGPALVTSGTNTLGIGSNTGQSGTISIGGGTGAPTVNIGTGATANVVAIGNLIGNTVVDLSTGTGGLQIVANGNSNFTTVAGSMNIGAQNQQTGTITIGSNVGNSTVIINSGASQIEIGATNAQTNAITIGGGTGAPSVYVGTGVTTNAVYVGTLNGASATSIQAGTAGIALLAPLVRLNALVNIYAGAGAPNNALALEVGDMYINTTAASAVTRLYIATAANTWTNVTCAA